MAIEYAHQPWTKGTPLVEARQAAPCQQKSSLCDLFGKGLLVTESQSRGHGDSMMILPELPKGLLVSTRCSLDEIIFTGKHYISFPLKMIYGGEAGKGSIVGMK